MRFLHVIVSVKYDLCLWIHFSISTHFCQYFFYYTTTIQILAHSVVSPGLAASAWPTRTKTWLQSRGIARTGFVTIVSRKILTSRPRVRCARPSPRSGPRSLLRPCLGKRRWATFLVDWRRTIEFDSELSICLVDTELILLHFACFPNGIWNYKYEFAMLDLWLMGIQLWEDFFLNGGLSNNWNVIGGANTIGWIWNSIWNYSFQTIFTKNCCQYCNTCRLSIELRNLTKWLNVRGKIPLIAPHCLLPRRPTSPTDNL